ncbi:hypothetical protein EJ110_NYTH03581 [Nymphaea thermarum]|nr:hypothetical protein EJ110_NYTH03581 [Nymphaea thermarum]
MARKLSYPCRHTDMGKVFGKFSLKAQSFAGYNVERGRGGTKARKTRAAASLLDLIRAAALVLGFHRGGWVWARRSPPSPYGGYGGAPAHPLAWPQSAERACDDDCPRLEPF